VSQRTASGATAYGAGDGDVVLATWPLLLDRGRMQDGEPFLAGTARASVARVESGARRAARGRRR
jgi:NADH-quinone oxidoreductase subunit G